MSPLCYPDVSFHTMSLPFRADHLWDMMTAPTSAQGAPQSLAPDLAPLFMPWRPFTHRIKSAHRDLFTTPAQLQKSSTGAQV